MPLIIIYNMQYGMISLGTPGTHVPAGIATSVSGPAD